jgi:hypothetical protein
LMYRFVLIQGGPSYDSSDHWIAEFGHGDVLDSAILGL